MFDEVIGKPVGRVLEILAAENFLGKAATNCMFSSGVGMQPPRVRRRPPAGTQPNGLVARGHPAEVSSSIWSTVRLRPRSVASAYAVSPSWVRS